ncbi:hypothetical protein [Streptomyces sp. SID9124]|uniref:hypothetical protein n=1 Tax=Streptomyces sp. SID9124 TaxID=2706108 RepID=UPI0013DE9E30|nr:hypothetical protein [Streptomyces sp. SID9124]NED16321.1 hypothetical protein [Streptomyces sp. SID9124]
MYKLARTGAVLATGLLTALALTGCGSDGDKDDSGKDSGVTASPASGGASGGGDSEGDAKDLEGAWAGESDDKPVVLSVSGGKAVVVADSHVCSGTVSGTGKPELELKCVDGDTTRITGAVESNDGKTVVVAWGSGTKDTLAKTDSDALENLPDLPNMSALPELPTP